MVTLRHTNMALGKCKDSFRLPCVAHRRNERLPTKCPVNGPIKLWAWERRSRGGKGRESNKLMEMLILVLFSFTEIFRNSELNRRRLIALLQDQRTRPAEPGHVKRRFLVGFLTFTVPWYSFPFPFIADSFFHFPGFWPHKTISSAAVQWDRKD